MNVDIKRWKGFLTVFMILFMMMVGYSSLPYVVGQESNGDDADDGSVCALCCFGWFATFGALIFGSLFITIIFFVISIGTALLIIWGIVKFFIWIKKREEEKE